MVRLSAFAIVLALLLMAIVGLLASPVVDSYPEPPTWLVLGSPPVGILLIFVFRRLYRRGKAAEVEYFASQRVLKGEGKWIAAGQLSDPGVTQVDGALSEAEHGKLSLSRRPGG